MHEPAPGAAFTHRQILVIIGGLIAGMALAGLDATIVSPSLPTIVGDLGGVESITWVVTAYLLFSTVTTPLYGRFGDLFGRARLFRIAIVVFVSGSMLCGLAPNLATLVAARAVQGIGAGGIMATSFAIMGDVVSPRERGRYTGYLASVFAVTSVIGPLLGGYLTDHLSWRWVFYVNVPVGALALVITSSSLKNLPGPRPGASRRVDVAGAGLLICGVGAMLLGLEWGGTQQPWGSPLIVGLLGGGAAVLGVFLWWERRVPEPLLPPRLFANDVVSVTGAMSFLIGMAMYGAMIYLPLQLQVVRDVSVSRSGMLLTPMMIGVVGAAIPVGRLITRTGRYKFTGPLGFGMIAVGFLALLLLGDDAPLLLTFGVMAVLGCGVGSTSPPLTVAVQNAVDPTDMGVATSTTMFLRNLGSSVGVAVFGAIFASRLTTELTARLPAGAADDLGGNVTGLLREPSAIAALPDPVEAAVRAATSSSVHAVFLGALLAAALGLLVSLRLRELPLRTKGAAAMDVEPALVH